MKSLNKLLIAFFIALLPLSLSHAEDLEAKLDGFHRLLDRQAYTDAEPKLRAFLKKRPKNLEARFLLAVLLSETNRHPQALQLFEQLSKEHPRQPEPYNNLGVLYARQGMMDLARASFLKAVMSHPSYATAHRNLQAIYANMAARAYGQALELEEVFDEQPDLAILKKTGPKAHVVVERDEKTLQKLATLKGELEVLRKIRDQAQKTLVRQQETEKRLKQESTERKKADQARGDALKRATAAENELKLKIQEISRLTQQYKQRLENEQKNYQTTLATLTTKQHQSAEQQARLKAQLNTLEQAKLNSEQALSREKKARKKSQLALDQEKKALAKERQSRQANQQSLTKERQGLEVKLNQLTTRGNDQQATIASLKAELKASKAMVTKLQGQHEASSTSMSQLKQDLEAEQKRYAAAQSAIKAAKIRQEKAQQAQKDLNNRFNTLNDQIRKLEKPQHAAKQLELAAQTEPLAKTEPTEKPVTAPKTSTAPVTAVATEPRTRSVADEDDLPIKVELKTTPITTQNLPETEEVTVVEDWRDDVRSAVESWRQAWSDQDVSAYLAVYAKTFRPPQGRSIRTWKKRRAQRLKKPGFIRITVDNLRIVSMHGGRAKVSFTQSYRSDTYRDKIRKILLMERQDAQWKILRELSDG
ncbi:L,D-transpeptidase Cds6 family protein [Magnetococcus sp. PR-3]|uniref:L,D-transpeptidase Cds6 family protein n=1 Tax=Magnetococcus sp. PR-3 TaxID=3120355 RepID=UPI002FCDE9CC